MYLQTYVGDPDTDWRADALESVTKNFADEFLIAQGSNGKVYKGSYCGQLIVARQYPNPTFQIKETMMCQILKHKHIMSDMTMAYPGYIINDYMANESLDKHLSDPTLTWMDRLKICVGVVQALNYMHSGLENDYIVIHGNIKSSKILLDENWEPKVRCCGNAFRVRKGSPCFPINYKGTLEYKDPVHEMTQSLTPKSDVFSFGVVLFEVLFGRKASMPIPDQDNWTSFAQFARLCYEEKRLDETAFYCLEEQRSQRPDMDLIVKRLEVGLEHQKKHQATVEPTTTTTTAVEDQVSNRLKGKNLDHLKLQLSEIRLATNNFSEECRIGYGGYGEVYKANLNHFDGESSLVIDGNVEGELPKKHSTVAIKRLFSRADVQGEEGFIAEIDLLSSCKHENVVSLIGFCHEDHEMILIYEYASNGSLENYLGDIKNMKNFNWAQRIQICLDIANGLYYLHTSTEDKKSIIHRDMKSTNILLDDKWRAKIADFGLSVLHQTNQEGSTLITSRYAGTEGYLDPEYQGSGRLKTEIDVYSLGVILFEIVCGRLTYDQSFNQKGIASIARQYFEDGTLKELVDPKIKEINENIFMLNGALNQDSLDVFSNIAYQCLSETQSKRPTMEIVIKELQKALNFQKSSKDNLYISLEDIKLATQNFSDDKCFAEGKHWKQYEGEIPRANADECTTIIVKRWDSKSPKRESQYLVELQALHEYKDDNIIGLVGYCNENDEKIIVYEHGANGKLLSKHLDDVNLTWLKCLKISINIASGLTFLHKGDGYKETVLHKNIRCSSIILDGDWKAKMSNLELCKHTWGGDGTDKDEEESLKYMDDPSLPQVTVASILDYEDVFSLGVVLMEILSGKLALQNNSGPLARSHYEKAGNFDEYVFEGIIDQIHLESLDRYSRVAYECLRRFDRAHASSVVTRLKKALELQEDYEVWEPKLPHDYVEIVQMSRTPKIHNKLKRTLYRKLTKGILLQQDKKLFTLGSNGERTETLSATQFSYKNRGARNWRSIRESRFHKVAEMLVISNLNVKIKLRTQLLSPGIHYGIYLVFKFNGPQKFLSKSIYVNLAYKIGSETFHSYFAKWRDDNWMMIELHQFLNHKDTKLFDVLIESFSKYYCGSGSIYIEGIEFRVIDSLAHEEPKKITDVEQVQKLNHDEVQVLPTVSNEMLKGPEICGMAEKLLLNDQGNDRKCFMLAANKILHGYPIVKLFRLNSTTESRYQEVIELLPQQVFRITSKIGSQMLSPNTEYMCFLVFKLSEKCRGLHCPVKVRDILYRKSKVPEIFYFRSPNPWNLHNINRVPQQRNDGWLEVKVWKFNSSRDLKNDYIHMNLKLISYEGTMCGLIVFGLEFRLM